MLPSHHLPPQTRPRRTAVYAAVVLTVVSVGGIGHAVANTIEEIKWTTDSLGRTLVSATTTEPFESAPYRAYPVADPPRLVVVIQGIASPFRPSTISVGDRNVHRIRVGHHDELSLPELHLVFDLTSDSVEVIELRHLETRLELVLGTPDPAAPTSTPSSTWTHQPLSSPTPSETPTPSPSQSYSDRPAPPVIPPARTAPAPRAIPTSPPTSEPVTFATPIPEAEAPVASHVIDLVATPRGDGSTLLRITADGNFPQGCARHLEVDDDPPRIVLTIRDVSAPELPRSIEVGGQNIEKIRLIHDAEVSQGELHLVLHLTGPGISVTELKQVGPNLVLRLSTTD